MNTLLISGHFHLKDSVANKIIIDEIIKNAKITYYDLLTTYPNLDYNIQAEQLELTEADLIIIQFPFLWYGLPAHVKLWIEKVFTYGFAHGPNGNKLKGKKLLFSLTTGGNQKAYSSGGHNQYPIETFLIPLKLVTDYCGMEYLSPIYSYDMSSNPNSDNATVKQKTRVHAQKILDVIATESRKHASRKPIKSLLDAPVTVKQQSTL